MIVVSDTTPLISLMKVGRLALLRELFQRVIIPETVLSELTASYYHADEAIIVKHSDYIQVASVIDEQHVDTMLAQERLDRGECEAITLSKELKANLLLIDEARGRKVAQKYGLKITGTIGILLQAYDKKLLSKTDVINDICIMQNSNIRLGRNMLELVQSYLQL